MITRASGGTSAKSWGLSHIEYPRFRCNLSKRPPLPSPFDAEHFSKPMGWSSKDSTGLQTLAFGLASLDLRSSPHWRTPPRHRRQSPMPPSLVLPLLMLLSKTWLGSAAGSAFSPAVTRLGKCRTSQVSSKIYRDLQRLKVSKSKTHIYRGKLSKIMRVPHSQMISRKLLQFQFHKPPTTS